MTAWPTGNSLGVPVTGTSRTGSHGTRQRLVSKCLYNLFDVVGSVFVVPVSEAMMFYITLRRTSRYFFYIRLSLLLTAPALLRVQSLYLTWVVNIHVYRWNELFLKQYGTKNCQGSMCNTYRTLYKLKTKFQFIAKLQMSRNRWCLESFLYSTQQFYLILYKFTRTYIKCKNGWGKTDIIRVLLPTNIQLWRLIFEFVAFWTKTFCCFFQIYFWVHCDFFFNILKFNLSKLRKLRII